MFKRLSQNLQIPMKKRERPFALGRAIHPSLMIAWGKPASDKVLLIRLEEEHKKFNNIDPRVKRRTIFVPFVILVSFQN